MTEWISDIAFADPWYFLLLLVIPLLSVPAEKMAQTHQGSFL